MRCPKHSEPVIWFSSCDCLPCMVRAVTNRSSGVMQKSSIMKPLNQIIVLAFFGWLPFFLPAQNPIQIGGAFTYDFGIDLPELEGFEPYTTGRHAAFSIEGYVGIPMGRLTVYPTYRWSIPSRTVLIRNLQGDYIPEGYGLSLPYDPNGPSVVYGDDYYDLSSDAETWQNTFGAYLLFHIGGGVEIGSGIFRRKKTTYVYSRVLYDEYYYVSSTGEITDDYSYWDTYLNYIEEQEHREVMMAYPLVLQWRYAWDFLYTGMGVSYWLGPDRFWSFRYTMGIQF